MPDIDYTYYYPSINELKFEFLTKNKLEEAIRLLMKKLLSSKSISVNGVFDISPLGLKELQELYRNISTDGYSIIVTDKRNDKIVAVSFNKLHVSK